MELINYKDTIDHIQSLLEKRAAKSGTLYTAKYQEVIEDLDEKADSVPDTFPYWREIAYTLELILGLQESLRKWESHIGYQSSYDDELKQYIRYMKLQLIYAITYEE